MNQQIISIIIAYFNFSGSKTRMKALKCCLDSLPEDVEIVLVALGKLPKISHRIKLIELTDGAVVWQRERFWNIALQNISSNSKIVVWLDADIICTDNSWLSKLERQLSNKLLVQLYSSVTDAFIANENLVKTSLVRQSIVKYFECIKLSPKKYFSTSGVSLSLGYNPGFAWATKSEIIHSIRFPDFLILGSGDKAFLAAAMGFQNEYADALNLNQNIRQEYLNWSGNVNKKINNQIGYIKHNILHIYQGNYEKRFYKNRYNLISSHDFILSNLLYINQEGSWCWSTKGNRYKKCIDNYFKLRND